MAKSRSTSTPNKVIAKSDCPIYLIDGQQSLVYGNDAFFDWIGSDDRDELIGTRLVYSNSADLTAAQRQLCGLTPPPELTAGFLPFSATVRSPSGGIEKIAQATAHFTYIEDTGDQRCLLAVVSLPNPDRQTAPSTPNSAPTPAPTPTSSDDESASLHWALQELAASLKTWHNGHALIGTSQYVARLQKQVKAASQHTMEFTILGPAGSGREQLARLIMQQRAGGGTGNDDELVTLHGYVADPELIRSCVAEAMELGREHAIETNHRTDKTQSWLLILDADQLDAPSQAELWSLLQTESSRLKIVATAERDPMLAVQDDDLHSGLAHLLTTHTIATLPLSQHLVDLPVLAQHEIEQCNVDREIQLSGFSDAVTQMLGEYHWPGNLAELSSVVSAAAGACQGHEIGIDDLPKKFRYAIAALKSPPQDIIEIDLDKYLTGIELQLVSRALQMAKGNKTKASKLLGISRAKLLRRIQHFELQKEIADPAKAPVDADLSSDDFRPLGEPVFEEADD